MNRFARRRCRKKSRHAARRRLIPRLEALEDRSLLAPVFWDGGGGNSDWNNALNWSSDRVPISSETVVIELNSTFTVDLTSDVTIAGLAIGGASGTQTLNVSGRILSLAGPSSIGPRGSVVLQSGTLDGAGSLQNAGTIRVEQGVSVIMLGLQNDVGSNLSISGVGGCGFGSAATLTVASGFSNAGSITLNTQGNFCGTGDGSAALNVASGSLVNTASGTILSRADNINGSNRLNAAIDNQGLVDVQHTLDVNAVSAEHTNAGTLRLRNAPLTVTQSGTNPRFTNTGLIEADGDLTVQQSGTNPVFINAGTLHVLTGRALTVTGGTFHHQSGALGGAGSLIFSSSTMQFTPNYTNDTFLSLRGAAVTGSGTLTNAATMQIVFGASTIGVPFANAAGGNLSISGVGGCGSGSAATLTVASGFSNAGNITLNTQGNFCGTGDGSATLNVNSGTLVNSATGTIVARADNTNGRNTLNAAIDNRGLFDVQHQLTIDRASAQHTSAGTVRLRNAPLIITQSGTNPRFTNSGLIEADGDLTVQQTGTSPVFTNAGTLNVLVGRTMTVTGGVFHHQSGALSSAGSFVFSTSTLQITPDYTNNALLSLRAASVTGPGKLTNSATVQTVFGTSTIGVSFENAATGNLTISGVGGCGNGSSATLTVANGFTNAGNITLNTQGNFCGTGEGSATLNVTSGTLQNAVTGTILSRADNINGSNRLHADLLNQGTLDVAAMDLRLEGSLTNANSGRIAVSVAGAAPDQFSELVVTGGAALDGTLAVNVVAPFVPATGQRFEIIQYASASSNFASFEGLVSGTRRLRTSKEPTRYALVGDSNSAPQANLDTTTTIEGQPTPPIFALLNDTDPDIGDAVSLVTFSQGSGGVVTQVAPGQLVYTPNPGFAGNDVFNYTIQDQGGLLSVGVVTVTVTPAQDPLDQLVQALNAGFATTFSQLPSLAQNFNVGGQGGTNLPLVTENLNDVFALSTQTGQLATPRIANVDSSSQLVSVLHGLGIEILCLDSGVFGAAPGIAACSAGDLILLRYEREIGPLIGTSGLDPATTGLFSAGSLVGDLAQSISYQGALELDLTLGVDDDGFFVASLPATGSAAGAPSRLALDFAVGLDISGQTLLSEIFELRGAEVSISPQIDMALVAGADGRLRPSELTAGSVQFDVDVSDVDLRLVAREARLFPRQNSGLFSASVDGLAGSLGMNGSLDLSALRVGIEVGEALDLAANNVAFHFDPSGLEDPTVIARLQNVAVQIPALPSLPTASIGELSIILNRAAQTFTIDVQDLQIQGDTQTAAAVTTTLAAASNASPDFAATSADGQVSTAAIGEPAATPVERPLILIPSSGFSESDNPFARSPHSRELKTDRTFGVYTSLLETLQLQGYVLFNEDDPIAPENDSATLFVANYDWALPIAPGDTDRNGHLSAATAHRLTDGRNDTRLDYIADALRQAVQLWTESHNGEFPDGVDIIAHGNGGLIARAYLQSAAYPRDASGAPMFVDPQTDLPAINNLVMVGSPQAGEPGAGCESPDNWPIDPATAAKVGLGVLVAGGVLFVGAQVVGGAAAVAPVLVVGAEVVTGTVVAYEVGSTLYDVAKALELFDDLDTIADGVDTLCDLFPGEEDETSTEQVINDDAIAYRVADLLGPVVEANSFVPEFQWQFHLPPGENVESVHLYVSSQPEDKGLLPIPKKILAGGEANSDFLSFNAFNDVDVNAHRILTRKFEEVDLDALFDPGENVYRFALPPELQLTAGQKYYWTLEVETDDPARGRTFVPTAEFFTPFVTTADRTRLPAVTLITHGFQLPYLDSTVPDDYKEFARIIAASSNGLVFQYDKNTGDWLPDPVRNPTAKPVQALTEGRPLILLSDWAIDSSISDSGFSEAAADSLFAGLVQLDHSLEGVARAANPVFRSPIHLIGFSRGTPVTAEIAQRIGTYFPDVPEDLHVTTLDPHDFRQDSLDVPLGAAIVLLERIAASGAVVFPPLIAAQLSLDLVLNQLAATGNLVVEYGDFRDPEIFAWDKVNFHDNYWQNTASPTLTVPPSLTPNGRPIPSVDLELELNGRPGFTRDEGLGGPHMRAKSWYIGTADLDLFSFPNGDNAEWGDADGTDRIWRNRQSLEHETYRGVNEPWYRARETDSNVPWQQGLPGSADVVPENELTEPWEGIGAGWSYSVLGGGSAHRPPSQSDAKQPVSHNNSKYKFGDRAVPTVFNGHFDVSLRPDDGRFPLPIDVLFPPADFVPGSDGPSWKEVPGWSFHGGSGGLRQGEHIIDLVDLSLFPDDASVQASVFGRVANSVPELISVVVARGGRQLFGSEGQSMLALPADLPSLFGLSGEAFLADPQLVQQIVGLREISQSDPTHAKLDRAYAINDTAPLSHNRMFIPGAATALEFDYWVSTGGADDQLDIFFADAKGDRVACSDVATQCVVSLEQSAAGFQTFRVPLPLSLLGSVATFTFQPADASVGSFDSTVLLDNVRLSFDGPETLDNSGDPHDNVVFFSSLDGIADSDGVEQDPSELEEVGPLIGSASSQGATAAAASPTNAPPAPPTLFSQDIVIRNPSQTESMRVLLILVGRNDWLGMIGPGGLQPIHNPNDTPMPVPLDVTIPPGGAHVLRFSPTLDANFLPNLTVDAMLRHTTVTVVKQTGTASDTTVDYDLFALIDASDDDADDQTFHFANTVVGASRHLFVQTDPGISLVPRLNADTFEVAPQTGGVRLTLNADLDRVEDPLTALFDVQFVRPGQSEPARSVLAPGEDIEVRGLITAPRIVQVPVFAIRPLLEELLACKPNFEQNLTCDADLVGTTAEYANFFNLTTQAGQQVQLQDGHFRPQDYQEFADGLRAGINDVYNQIQANQVTFNPLVDDPLPGEPFPTDILIGTSTNLGDRNDTALARAAQFFARTNFNELLLAQDSGVPAPIFTTRSNASIRYRLDQIIAYNRATSVTLYVDTVAREARPGQSIFGFGADLGRTLAHEFGHNFGLHDQYIYTDRPIPSFPVPVPDPLAGPNDTSQNVMQEATVSTNLTASQKLALALAFDNPEIQDNVLNWSDPVAARSNLCRVINDWFRLLEDLKQSNFPSTSERTADGLARRPGAAVIPVPGACNPSSGASSASTQAVETSSASAAAGSLNTSSAQASTTPASIPHFRNSFLLDLNAGRSALTGALNADVFDGVGSVTVTYAGGLPTTESFTTRRGGDFGGSVRSILDHQATSAEENQFWLQGNSRTSAGDGRVPLSSSALPLLGVKDVSLAAVGTGDVTHAGLPTNESVQRAVLTALGRDAGSATIVPSSARTDMSHVIALAHAGAEALVIDAQGRRLGFTAATGVLTEIPGSIYRGGTFGIGYLFEPVAGPLTYQIIGTGGGYFVQAGAIGNKVSGGTQLHGTLAAGETITETFEVNEVFEQPGIPTLLELINPSVGGNFTITIHPDSIDVTGDVIVGADGAALFPDTTTPELDGAITATNIAISVSLETGAVHLESGTASVNVPGVIVATASTIPDEDNPGQTLPGLEFDFNPNNSDPTALLGALRGLTFSTPLLPDLPQNIAKINEVALRRNGFDLDVVIGDPAAKMDIGSFLELTGPQLALDIGVTLAPQLAVSGSIGIGAASAELLPGNPLGGQLTGTVTGLAGTLSLDTGDVTLSATSLTASFADVVTIAASQSDPDHPIQIHFTDDPQSPTPFIQVPVATLTLPLLGSPVTFDIQGFELSQSAELSFTTAGACGANLLDTIGMGGILPLELNCITLSGLPGPGDTTLPVRLDQFRLDVAGSLNFSVVEFTEQTGLVPTVQIGCTPDPVTGGSPCVGGTTFGTNSTTPFELGVLFDQGDLSFDLQGSVVLGLSGLQFGPVTAGVTLFLGEFDENGHYQLDGVVGAELDIVVAGEAADISGDAFIHFDEPVAGQTTLDVSLTVGFDFDVGDNPLVGLSVEGATATFDFFVTVDSDFNLVDSDVTLASATADLVEVGIGDPQKRLIVLSASGPELDFANPDAPLVSLLGPNKKLTLSFPALDSLGPPPESTVFPGPAKGFEVLTGTAENFEIGKDFAFLPSEDPQHPFTVTLEGIPSLTAFGLPHWFPLRIDALGMRMPPAVFTGDLAAITFLVSGGLSPVTNEATGEVIWPIEATVDNLPISVKKLAEGKLLEAVEPPSGFKIGMEPFTIGEAMEVGGGFGLHTVTDPLGCAEPILYGEIEGFFTVAGISGELRLIISEYGPVLASLTVPVALPLGPTGLILEDVTGGIAFGPAQFPVVDIPADVENADAVRDAVVKELLEDETTFAPIELDDVSVHNALLALARINEGCGGAPPQPRFTWDEGFAMALAGEFTTVASPGILNGTLNLAAEIAKDQDGDLSVKFLGSGIARAWGMELGSVGALLDLSQPLAPQYTLAFATAGDSPLKFLLPADAEFVLHLDTAGVAEAALIGAHTLLDELLTGVLGVRLEDIAQALDRDRTRPLVRLLEIADEVQINADLLLSRLSEHFAANVAALATLDLTQSGALFSAFLQEVFRTADNQIPDEDVDDFLAQFTTKLGDATRSAVRSAFDVFNPRFALSGTVQPTIFGLAVGDPVIDGDILIDKRGVFVGFDASLHDLTGKLTGLILPFGLGEFLFDVVTLGLSDRLRFDLKLPLGGIAAALMDTGQLPQIDPFGNWVGGFTGQVKWLGFELASLSGYLFAPGSDAEVLARTFVFDDSTTEFPDPVPPIDPVTGEISDRLKIPLSSGDRQTDLIQFGGLIATSQFLLPALLADPVGLLIEMNRAGMFALDPGEDLGQFATNVIDTINGITAGLGTSQELGRMQLYIPTPFVQTAQQWLDAAYLAGFVDMKLLSLPLARFDVEAQADGLALSANYPFLAGARVEVLADFNEVNVNDAVENLAQGSGVNLQLPQSSFTAPIPRVRLMASLDADRLAEILAAPPPGSTSDQLSFNLPEFIVGAGDVDAQIRFFSPLYNFGNPDPDLTPVERNGGMDLDAHLSFLNLIENAQFHFEASLFGEAIIPDYLATADLEAGLIIPGLGVLPADFEIFQQELHARLEKTGLRTVLGLSGEVGLLGLIDFDVDGELGLEPSGLFGQINLCAADPDCVEGDLASQPDPNSGVQFFDFDGTYALQVNTTDLPHGDIPAGPYLGLQLAGSASLFDGLAGVDAFDFGGTFDLVIAEEGFSADLEAELDVNINFASLPFLSDIDPFQEGRQPFPGVDLLPPLQFGGGVIGHFEAIDGRIEGSLGMAPGADGFQDGDFQLTLDRWGCLGLDRYKADRGEFERFQFLNFRGIPLLSLDACNQHVFVDNQRMGETAGDTDIIVGLAHESQQKLRVDYRLENGTAVEGVDFLTGGSGTIYIEPGDRSGRIPVTIRDNDDDDGNRAFRVVIAGARYVTDVENEEDETTICDIVQGCVAPFSPGDNTARITIVNDDLAPPPVNIYVGVASCGPSQTFQDGSQSVFSTIVPEGGNLSLVVCADRLDDQDSVRLAYRLRPRAPSLATATLGSDFFASYSGQGPDGIITLIGGAPRTISITTTQDARYELDELFEIEFEIIQEARLSPDTDLTVDVARVAIDNDDLDVPPGTLVFYDFDTVAAGGDPYRYDTRPEVFDDRVWATPFAHRDDHTNHALIFEQPGDQVTAPAFSPSQPLPTNQFTIDFWMNPGPMTGARTILALGGGSLAGQASLGEGLEFFLENGLIKYRLKNTGGFTFSGSLGPYQEGQWQHVLLMANLRPLTADNAIVGFVNGVQVHEGFGQGTLAVGLGRLVLGQTPGNIGSSYVGLLDEFHVWSRNLTQLEIAQVLASSVNGNEPGLLIEYRFDEGLGGTVSDHSGHGWTGRLGTFFGTGGIIPNNPLADPVPILGPTGRPEWIVVLDSPVANLPRYDSVSAEEPNGVPKIEPVDPVSDPSSAIVAAQWADLITPIESAPYYRFMVGTNAPQTGGGVFDFARMMSIRIDGIDFFEEAGGDGPTRWELRYSRDNFNSVLASGTTNPGADYQHHREIFEQSVHLASLLHPNVPVEFRLYGLDMAGGSWSIDDFALIAGVVPAPTFNLPPIAPPALVNAETGSTSLPFNPISGASDPNNDPIAIVGVAVPPGSGFLNRLADGRFTFTPTLGQAANVPLAFTIMDRWGATVTKLVTVHPLGGAEFDSFIIKEDAVLTGNVLGNDRLLAGQAVTVALVGSAPAAAQFGLSSNGSFSFRPLANFAGKTGFKYQVQGPDWIDQAEVAIVVAPQPDTPVAKNDLFKVDGGSILTVAAPGVLQNDSDADGDRLTAILDRTTSSGILTFVADGSFTYRPNAGFSGTDGFTYIVQDATGLRAGAAVTITVVKTALPPDAVNDSITVPEDGFVALTGLLSNDRDPEGGPLTIRAFGTPAHGTITTSLLGTFYRPAKDYFGPDSFLYTVIDSQGLTDAATVAVTVSPVNDAPLTKPDGPFPVVSRGTLVIAAPGVLGNDKDIEGQPMTVVLVANPTKGTVKLSADGSFVYNSSGTTGTDLFTYRAMDTLRGLSVETAVQIGILQTITINPDPVFTDPLPVIDGSTGGTGGTVTPIMTVKGYIADGATFLDANLNGVWDFTDLNGDGVFDFGEPAEPRAATADDGGVTLIIPDTFDLDGSGFFEPHEGVLVSVDGIITGTTHALALPLRATLGARVVTPLTSLLTSLVLDTGLTAAQAQSRVLAALDLPPCELLGIDPIAATLAGDEAALPLLAAHKTVANAYVQIASLLGGAARLPASRIGLAVMSALSEAISPPGATLNLSDAEQLFKIILSAGNRLQLVLDHSAIEAAAHVIAAGSEAIEAVQPQANQQYVETLTRIESAAQGKVAEALILLGAGRIEAATIISQYTGAALSALIASAPLGVLLPTQDGPALANLYATPAVEGGSATLFGNITGGDADDAFTLIVNWGDGRVAQFNLEPGATTFRIDHPYADDQTALSSGKTAPIGIVLVSASQAVDAASVPMNISNATPEFSELNYTPLIVAGSSATIFAAALDASLLDTHKLSVTWGDGQVGSRTMVAGPDGFFLEHNYVLPGRYAVEMTITDDDGGSVSRTLAIDVIAATPPAVQQFQIGDGSLQRSMVSQATVVFNQPVAWDSSAASLIRNKQASYSVVAENPSGDGRTYVLTFLGPKMVGGSLPDGSYTLTIPAASVTSMLGDSMAATFKSSFHRLFGDADGDRDVDSRDRKAFTKVFKSRQFEPRYVAYFDHDSDGDVDHADQKAFNQPHRADALKSAASGKQKKPAEQRADVSIKPQKRTKPAKRSVAKRAPANPADLALVTGNSAAANRHPPSGPIAAEAVDAILAEMEVIDPRSFAAGSARLR